MVETISEIIKRISPYYSKKEGESEAEHELDYDSPAEGLEPIYFFITDLLSDFGFNVEKLVDNFTSSPGSGHFGELGQRASLMQQYGSKMLADINTVLRSILNLVYDLKDFKLRLQHYEGVKSKDKSEKEAAILSLKQIWMDKVDISKGNSSIKAMALSQAGFQSLIDAFLIIKDVKDVDKIDLNERIKRILRPRIQEFNTWLIQSEKELKKRYELERNYLKSQVNSLKLYSRWAKPYLKAAQQLSQKDLGRNADMVKAFNTIILELTLLGKKKVDLKSAAMAGDLPEKFLEDSFLKKLKRDYYICIFVDFYFRGIPQKISQRGDYSMGGKTKITFRTYALNGDEIKKLDEEISKADIVDALELVEGATTESLDKIKEEIDMFLEEQDKEEKKKSSDEDINPFWALFGVYDKKQDSKNLEPIKKDEPVKEDTWIESNIIRPFLVNNAKESVFNLFNTYKKAHGMVSYI